MDEESEEVDMADVEKAYEESFVTLQEGQIVKGTVVQVGQNEALVDVGGYKSEGVIPLQELVNIWMNSPEEVIKKGDEIEVYVVSVEDQDGKLVLSKKRADEEKAMESIRAAYDAGELISGVVKDVVKGGLIADIGMQAFIPASQAADRYVEDLRSLVGEELKFKIIELDPRKRRVVLSRRKAIEEESAHKQKETLENLEEGQVLSGVVRRLTDFGAFVDIGGIDGLLHISEMSWGRIRHPSEVVSIGDTIEVKVLGVNRENNRISLGLKQVLANPWEVAAENYPVGSIITGKVVRFTRFGAFIEIEPGIDGLLHISQISSKRVAKPEDALELEQMVEVKVIAQNPTEQKIGLSMIEVEQDRAKEEYLRFIAAQEEEQTEGGTIGDRFQQDEVPKVNRRMRIQPKRMQAKRMQTKRNRVSHRSGRRRTCFSLSFFWRKIKGNFPVLKHQSGAEGFAGFAAKAFQRAYPATA
jgi:small subunit ribosomal protein S1